MLIISGMKKVKLIIKNRLNFLFGILSNGIDNYKKKVINQQKNILTQKIQSVGYNLSLNGEKHTIRGLKKIIIGNNVHIGNNIYIAAEGGLTIGDNTHISRNVTIYTINHNYNGKALPYDETTIYKPVTIESNVWIGMNVCILPGVKIGEGAIIGMGSVVNRDVEPYEIVGNASLIHIKYRSLEHYSNLKVNKNYGGVNGRPIKPDEIKKFRKNFKDHRKSKIVFVLGTGRSGTNSITRVLNQNPKCKALHEDIRQIIRISTDLAYYPEKSKKYFDELDSIFETKPWQANVNQILIHSDQRFWNLIPYLKTYFPNSKFIHLKRDVYSCVRSMYSRGWYADNEYPEISIHDWSKYRLQADRIGEICTKTWSDFSQVAKCTWYWYYINKQIEFELKKIHHDKVLNLELNELDQKLNLISEFVSEDNFKYHEEISNQVKPNNIEKYNIIDERDLKEEIDKILKVFDKV